MKPFKDFLSESKRQETLALAFTQILKKVSKEDSAKIQELILKGDNSSLNAASQLMQKYAE